MANFSQSLWDAAGRNPRKYSDYAIEMGQSPHSRDEVNELIAEACEGCVEPEQVTYIQSGKVVNSTNQSKCGRRLINGLISLVGKSSTVIAHNSDFEELHISHQERAALGFEQPAGFERWYIRPVYDD